jgi:hypothetical protein
MNGTTMNAKPRKQLSDQLDRLDEQLQRADAVLDALADGLNAAVADAAREGVRQAVKEAVIELLMSPDLRLALHLATAPAQPASAPQATEGRAPLWTRLFGRAARAARGLTSAAGTIAKAAAVRVREVTASAARVGRALRRVCPLWVLAIVGATAGAVLAVAGYLAPHGVSAALSGLNGGLLAAGMRVAIGFRRALRPRRELTADPAPR